MSEALDDFTVSGEDAPVLETPIAAAVETVADDANDTVGDELVDEEASEAGRTLANKRKSYKQVILEKTVAQKAAERERDEAKAEAARLKAATAPATETPKPAEPAYLTRPQPNQDDIGTKYADWEAYNRDFTEWILDERDARKDRATKAARDEQGEREIVATVQARIATFKETHPDYDDVVGKATIPDGSPSYQAILNHLRYSEHGPDLAYALGKDHTELIRIAGLAPGFAVAALGRLEGKLEAQADAAKSGTAPQAPPVTKAYPPIKPVSGSPATSDDGDADDLSPAAVDRHIAKENARERDLRVAGRRR